jgi:protein-tyrosine-phosphatase
MVLQLVAHPVRWRLMRELVQSDRAVWELTQLLEEPQSLISYHLGRLRADGLVSSRQSSADGRDSYYALDLAHCQSQFQAAGDALHPGLGPVPAPPAVLPRRKGRPLHVLFLCTGNSARSQMAEALLLHASGGTVVVASAGSNPKPLHPNAVRVMRKHGIDISANRTKHLDKFVNRRFDMVITLCDRVREVCPEFPSHPNRVHWSIADPALAGPSKTASYPAFERTAAELETRIGFLLHMLAEPSTKGRSSHAER